MMNTPLRHPVQERPTKRKVPISSPIEDDSSLADTVAQFNNDNGMPGHLKKIIGSILERVSRTDELIQRNLQLEERLEQEIAENSRLKKEIESLKSALSSSSNEVSPHRDPLKPSHGPVPNFHCDCSDRKEMLRSVVISGIAEYKGPSSTARVAHDFDCVKKIFEFLSIDCYPDNAFRMGKPNPAYPRLLKVVLPSTFFRNYMLRKAHKMKHFPISGIYIRPSLPKQERDRLRAERQHRSSGASVVNNASQSVVNSSTSAIPPPSTSENLAISLVANDASMSTSPTSVPLAKSVNH